uniref:Uncharacterized protein n=1 Tax=Myoviridae sp. ctJ2i1 TaxID=2825079 RepID=A0A8S5V1W9_9CAUD|nr:MAG TPA: hypothetical protein [Myoviridae sp. ctJ2i1]
MFGDRCPPLYIFISIVLDNTIILIREGGTVFDFRRLQHWGMARVASSLVVEYSPVTFAMYFGSVHSGLYCRNIFFLVYYTIRLR